MRTKMALRAATSTAAMHSFHPSTMTLRAARFGWLAIALAVLMTGCCGPYGGRGVCEPGCWNGRIGGCCNRCPAPPSRPHGDEFAEDSPPGHRRGRPVQRLAHHLKPHGALQPQVPVGPLPKFHPLPTRPVFEPGYFDAVVGPAEAIPYGAEDLIPVPTDSGAGEVFP